MVEAINFIQSDWRKRKLVRREAEYTDDTSLRIFCGTWNVNGKSPEKEEGDVGAWLFAGSSGGMAEVYAVGFQEIVELNPKNVALSDAESAKRSVKWENSILELLNARDRATQYVAVASEHLVGILLCVFVARRHARHVRCVASSTAGVGMFGIAGNKGGAAVRMQIYNSTLCFVSSHLAAHRKAVESRNSDFAAIVQKLVLLPDRADAMRGGDPVLGRYRRAMAGGRGAIDGAASGGGGGASELTSGAEAWAIPDHDIVFWLGDLNYRIATEVPIEEVFSRIASGDLAWLEAHDQLKIEHAARRVFAGFHEGTVTGFVPTYKYQVGTDELDQRPEKKMRAPAWCDRVLWTSSDPARVALTKYASYGALRMSDHKPVYATFDVDVKRLVVPELRRVLNEIQRRLDQWDNDCIPRVQLSLLDPATKEVTVSFSTSGDVDFGRVAYRTPVTRYLRLENVGQQMVAFRFLPKPEQTAVSKSWLRVSPEMAMIPPAEAVVIELTATVGADAAAALGAAEEVALDDILILHIENGADFFLPVTVGWGGSAFGLPLESLAALGAAPARRGDGAAPAPAADAVAGPSPIPKEIWRLVDALHAGQHCGTAAIFRAPAAEEVDVADACGAVSFSFIYRCISHESCSQFDSLPLTSLTLAKVRDALDAGRDFPAGTTGRALGNALVELLNSTGAPVVPPALCPSEGFDSAGAAWWVASLYEQLPPLRHNTLIYLVAFMRLLLEPAHAASNQLTAASLSEVFGAALFSPEPQSASEGGGVAGAFAGDPIRSRAQQASKASRGRFERRLEVGAILDHLLGTVPGY